MVLVLEQWQDRGCCCIVDCEHILTSIVINALGGMQAWVFDASTPNLHITYQLAIDKSTSTRRQRGSHNVAHPTLTI
jgi:hypothetical protein